MIIKTLSLEKYRNFKRKSLVFSPKTTVIVGPNASGKTNILESIFLLSTGKSFRVRVEEEMINYQAEIARIKGEIMNDSNTNLEIVLTRGEINIGTARSERVPRKKLFVNKVSRRLFNFSGQLKTVLFGPWDLELVTESPSVRRKFLDTVLSQVDKEYQRASLSYEKGLRQRNRLLFRIREEGLSRSQLLFWDRLLIKNGDLILRKREEFIDFINKKKKLDDQNFKTEYDRSAISAARLEQYAKEEVDAATTLVGPHRDDIQIFLKSSKRKRFRDLARYGSRGEQRMGVLWLKLAELSFIKEKTGQTPTLLLDDIFSELDKAHRKIVIDLANPASDESEQVIITTANPQFIKDFKRVEKIVLKG